MWIWPYLDDFCMTNLSADVHTATVSYLEARNTLEELGFPLSSKPDGCQSPRSRFKWGGVFVVNH